jgi:hypothetical protein
MAKRELIQPKPSDKRYVGRDDKGHFTEEQDDVGRSSTQDRRKEAKHEAPRGKVIAVTARPLPEVDPAVRHNALLGHEGSFRFSRETRT